MVYCTKCGAENPDDAKVCTQCGASLYPGAPPTRRYERRRFEEECFGIPRGSTIVGVAFGAIILMWGLIWILIQIYPEFPIKNPAPFALIVIGILIILGAYYGLRRRL